MIDGTYDLTADQHLGLVHVGSMIGNVYIGGCVTRADKLTTQLRMGVVDHHHGHLAHYLIIVNPRIKQGISQRDEEEKDEHTLVFEHQAHLVAPDRTSVAHAVDNLIEQAVFLHGIYT